MCYSKLIPLNKDCQYSSMCVTVNILYRVAINAWVSVMSVKGWMDSDSDKMFEICQQLLHIEFHKCLSPYELKYREMWFWNKFDLNFMEQEKYIQIFIKCKWRSSIKNRVDKV